LLHAVISLYLASTVTSFVTTFSHSDMQLNSHNCFFKFTHSSCFAFFQIKTYFVLSTVTPGSFYRSLITVSGIKINTQLGFICISHDTCHIVPLITTFFPVFLTQT